MTSWMPPAVAWVNTGPRLVTTKGAFPSKAGYRLGTTRTSQFPSASLVSSVGVTCSSLPGQKGQGREVSAWIDAARGAKAWGRVARSVLTTTQRPVRGSSRSWFISSCAWPLLVSDCLSAHVASPPRSDLRRPPPTRMLRGEDDGPLTSVAISRAGVGASPTGRRPVAPVPESPR